MFQIGDEVRITLEGWKEKYPKTYIITDKRETYQGMYLYKLKGVPNWGLGNMIEYPKKGDL